MNSNMSPLEALNESTFQHFFLRLPNPSFSTKTTAGTVHSFFSDGSPASSAPSSNYPSPYSLSPATYGNWTNSSSVPIRTDHERFVSLVKSSF
ncbi:hypothetical protein K435DRAFT_418667 [Dendrothele bispora CBS 962.96]|uniref:Uncharacterized protein n=1 Tax=Dendrothele bispora (strain CBS 962.96) TaxID=1314807 RepID=A0A4S8MVI9_DENBC|nr:hypothetical protein K435DRAFT_418667 [Dendrothele bispora CBS 962.96]